ncbi:type II toxin-antitoxin system RelE family toxin [Paenibacillus periandrae]|uniref:type II toxin-antitoxin system RelE family toxin n=1 Tax=Paenibacillus periandrae TaxID=1761741 RepID=UPI001F08C7A9|nr:hypothetical protein [Paenibacillus periandrae]
MFTIEFVSKRVEKEMNGFRKEEIITIQNVLEILTNNPRPLHLDYGSVNRCSEVKRIKAKRIRMFYTIDDKKGIIYIGKIDNRDSHCYGKNIRTWFTAS